MLVFPLASKDRVFMPVHLICPGCSHRKTAPDHVAGMQLRCPKCHARFTAPQAERGDQRGNPKRSATPDKDLMVELVPVEMPPSPAPPQPPPPPLPPFSDAPRRT